MKKWLLLSVGIVILMAIAVVLVVRAFIPTPIPEVPTIADCPLAIHINEIDLSTSGLILVSLDNLTREDISIDVSAFGAAVSKSLRLFDPTGNEWKWVDSKGRTGDPVSADNAWQWSGRWGQAGRITIEAGRTENFTLMVNPDYGLTAVEWMARMRGAPDRLLYVIDCRVSTGASSADSPDAIRVTASGETAYKPRP